MNITVESTRKKKSSFWTIASLVVLSIGAVISLGLSLVMASLSVISLFIPAPLYNTNYNLFSSLSTTVMLAVFGCLMIPGIVFSIQKLSRKQPEIQENDDPFSEMPFSRMTLPNTLLAVTAVILALVYLLGQRFDFPTWLLPFLQVPAVLVPLFWAYQFTLRKLYPRQAKRNWVVLGLDLSLQSMTTVILEIAVLIGILAVIVIWLVMNPDMIVQLQEIITELEQSYLTMTPEQAEQLMGDWLSNPWVIFIVQLFVSVLVPLLEELIKPMLVWRWIKRPLRPIDGFWVGLIGGMAFTLYENLGNLAQVAGIEGWYLVLLSRVGTSILHMATSAILGWALMKTFADRKILRAIGVYFGVVLLHGGWNFSAILQSFSSLSMDDPPLVFLLTPFAIPMLLLIALICSAILIFAPKLIQQQEEKSLSKLDTGNIGAP